MGVSQLRYLMLGASLAFSRSGLADSFEEIISLIAFDKAPQPGGQLVIGIEHHF